MIDQQIEKRLRTGNYDAEELVRWCKQRLEGSLQLEEQHSEELNRALSTSLPSCRVQLADIRYRRLATYPHRVQRMLSAREQDLLPILLARPAGGGLWVLDGRHRCEIAKLKGRDSVLAVIVDVDARFTCPWG